MIAWDLKEKLRAAAHFGGTVRREDVDVLFIGPYGHQPQSLEHPGSRPIRRSSRWCGGSLIPAAQTPPFGIFQ